MPEKLYAQRDLEVLWDYVMRHKAAMTTENLRDKGAIAAELAWRDAEIDRLKALIAPPVKPAPEMPHGLVLPYGYELVGVRLPKKGEQYIGSCGIGWAKHDFTTKEWPIIRRKPQVTSTP